MPDEEMIDKLVKDAASQYHPPYDDTAWGKMEVLLDKHMPQKKDRRRPFIFLLFFLLLGGALFFALENWQKKNTTTAVANADEKKSGNDPATATTKNTTVDATATMPTDNSGIAAADNSLPGQQQEQTVNTTSKTPVVTDGKNNGQQTTIDRQRTTDVAPKLQANTTSSAGTDIAAGRKNSRNEKGRLKIKTKNGDVADGDDALQKQKNEPADMPGKTKTGNAVTEPADNNNDINKTAEKKDVAITKKDSAATVKTETKKDTTTDKNKTAASTTKQNKKKFTDKIAVTLSAGADLSYVDINNTGKIKPAYGAGLRYALGKHLAVASGLYVSKKVYTASPYEYKFATGYPPQNLKQIGADCKVYEIPVSVYYSSRQVKNHNWLGGIGLSTLLMKNEAYDYRYQTPAGQSYSYQWSVSNQNKHYFSVLTVSGGYQYTLNNNLSFVAEPYVKIPLTGIGAGKLKLNSTGIMVTAAIKPFAKKK